eukprot:CAMPEP_0170649316 /NCGR_PEP_ID=MMETSP0224-20130122/45222_1 /TAXON_ID=285029 /ORGANISM="Togula jolla, Strain CCCM 725" /LENGTH=47 /DNA_ID= /DNA_START= /DNA_END= /DNA_ORIENTATION=
MTRSRGVLADLNARCKVSTSRRPSATAELSRRCLKAILASSNQQTAC